MPRSVSATRSSSRYAGTTTATRLPSTMRRELRRRCGPVPSRQERLGHERTERAEQQTDQPPDRGGVAGARRCHPGGGRGLDDVALLDVDGEREQLLVRVEVLLDGAAALLGEADRRVEVRAQEQPVREGDRAVPEDALELILLLLDA